MENKKRILLTLGFLFVAGAFLVSCINQPIAEATSAPVSANMSTTMPTTMSTAKPTSATISAEVIYRSQQCNVEGPRARWIQTQSQLQAVFTELGKNRISKQVAQPPAVDFSQYGALLLAMGRKNTGGFGLALMDSSVSVRDGVLQLSVQWREPERGMIVTQALTSPCLLLKVASGGFRRVVIKDQDGVTRFEVDLKTPD